MMRVHLLRYLFAAVILFCVALCSDAQLAQSPAEQSDRYGIDDYYANFFIVPAMDSSSPKLAAASSEGVTFGAYFARPGHITASPQFELGVTGPTAGGHPLDGFVSVNEMLATKIRRKNFFPALTLGYTRLFVTGNAADFGLSMDFGKAFSDHLYRIEVRDTYVFTGTEQNIISLRFGLGKLLPDD